MENFPAEAAAELGMYIPLRRALEERLTSLLFAQGECLIAHCFRDRSSLMEFGGS